MTALDLARFLEHGCEIARAAGEVILDHYRKGVTVQRKADDSPVTAADHDAEALIARELRALAPELPLVAEEEVAAGIAPTSVSGPFWLVDPLDGTKEFLGETGEFTVNIALVDDGRPVLGVVYAPALGDMYAAAAGGPARLLRERAPPRPIAARAVPADGAVIVSSRSHGDRDKLDALLAGIRVAGHRMIGSSLKLCLIAAGEADLYPRYGPTSEWDTAAGHAVLAIAGGSVRTLDGAPLRYGKARFLNPEFIARGRD